MEDVEWCTPRVVFASVWWLPCACACGRVADAVAMVEDATRVAIVMSVVMWSDLSG